MISGSNRKTYLYPENIMRIVSGGDVPKGEGGFTTDQKDSIKRIIDLLKKIIQEFQVFLKS